MVNHLMSKDFGPYGIFMIYECVCCYKCCHSNAVKNFWVLWGNIEGGVFTALDFTVILDGKFTGL
jgi:hypothetical protein